MKTYKIKNYKGNLVESLSRFQKTHKGMKIAEAIEDGKDLKIKVNEAVDDSFKTKFYVHCTSGTDPKKDEVELRTMNDLYNLWKDNGKIRLIVDFTESNLRPGSGMGEIEIYDAYRE